MQLRFIAVAAASLALWQGTAVGQSWQTASTFAGPANGATMPASVAWPVANRAFERGDIFTEQDFVTEQLPARAAVGLMPFEALVGKAASRAIPTGTALRPADVMEPQLVYRGEPVKVHVRIGGIDIASSGRALSDGQLGKSVRVFSNVSSRTLDAVVEGPGIVHLAGF